MNDRPSLVKAQAILESLVRTSRVPGIQYLVVSSHHTVFEFSGGWADIVDRRPLTSTTTLMAYSMSKTITAAAVLQLIQAEKLRLDDTIDRYIDWHPYGPGITIRQLLSHTSGIPNPVPLSWVHSPIEHDRFDESAELAAVLKKHSKLDFLPGAKFKYSNIGYWLLGPRRRECEWRIIHGVCPQTHSFEVGYHDSGTGVPDTRSRQPGQGISGEVLPDEHHEAICDCFEMDRPLRR